MTIDNYFKSFFNCSLFGSNSKASYKSDLAL